MLESEKHINLYPYLCKVILIAQTLKNYPTLDQKSLQIWKYHYTS